MLSIIIPTTTFKGRKMKGTRGNYGKEDINAVFTRRLPWGQFGHWSNHQLLPWY